MSLPQVICLMGPTCSGKTALAIELVQQFPFEIISVDSALVYRDMDIGTAKPNTEELRLAPHRLINICDPIVAYSAADFYRDCLDEIKLIHKMGKTPLLVGGTMFYFYALLQGLSPLPSANPALREKIVAKAAAEGWQAVHDDLQKVDPVAALRIHPNDPQRLQRALEVYYLSGKPLSSWFAEGRAVPLPFQFKQIALMPVDRAVLHQRIEQRFDMMLAEGFIAEVEKLYQRGDLHADLPAIKTVGYRQAWQYLQGELNALEMREKAIIATRQLAKRQLTWLKRFPAASVIECGDGALESVQNFLCR